MAKIVEFYRDRYYGTEHMYLVFGEYTEAIKVLTKKKTISKYDKYALEELGFEFREVFNEND